MYTYGRESKSDTKDMFPMILGSVPSEGLWLAYATARPKE